MLFRWVLLAINIRCLENWCINSHTTKFSHETSLQPISILTHEYKRLNEVCMHDSCRNAQSYEKNVQLQFWHFAKRQIRVNRELINIRVQHNGKRTS